MNTKPIRFKILLAGLLSVGVADKACCAQSEGQESPSPSKVPESISSSSAVSLNSLLRIKPGPTVAMPVPKDFVSRPPAPRNPQNDEPGIARMEADSSQGVMVKADLDRTEFRQLQRIRVIAEVKNIAKTHRWLPPSGINRYRLARIRVFNAKGEALPKTQFSEHEGAGLGVVGQTSGAAGSAFNPGASFRVDLIPNLVCDMTRPGEYWILVEIPLAHSLRGPGHDGMLYARAKPLKVRVLPEPATLPVTFVPEPDRP